MTLLAIPGEAWRALLLHPLRTLLAMLGMIIGVGAVVLMLAIGQGSQLTVNQTIASMGSNVLMVWSSSSSVMGVRAGAGSSPTITFGDARAIAQLPSVRHVSPTHSGNAQVISANGNWNTRVSGVTPEYFEVRDWTFADGASFDDTDVRSAALKVVLGDTVARNLFPDEDPMGKTVRILNRPFTVIGRVAPKGQNLDGNDQDDMVFVPVSTNQRKLFGNPFPGTVRTLFIEAQPGQLEQAEKDITELLRARHRIPDGGENDFTVRNPTAAAESAQAAARTMSLMLGAIASISLVVGGIGIMNIMLVSVTERTREIGIRMAVGARQRDILLQFLIEGVAICVVGGLLGLAAGVGIAWLLAESMQMTVVVSLPHAGLAFAAAAAIGLFFGLYPARRAALLKPVEALRFE